MRNILLIIIIIGLLAVPAYVYAGDIIYLTWHIDSNPGDADVFQASQDTIVLADDGNQYMSYAEYYTDRYNATVLGGGTVSAEIFIQGDILGVHEYSNDILTLELRRVEYYGSYYYVYAVDAKIRFHYAIELGSYAWRSLNLVFYVYNSSSGTTIQAYNETDKSLVYIDPNNGTMVELALGIFRRNDRQVEVRWSITDKAPRGSIFDTPENEYPQGSGFNGNHTITEVEYRYRVDIDPADYKRVIKIKQAFYLYTGPYDYHDVPQSPYSQLPEPILWIRNIIQTSINGITTTISSGLHWFYTTLIEPSVSFFYNLMPPWFKSALDLVVSIALMLLGFLPYFAPFIALAWILWIITGLSRGDMNPLIRTFEFLTGIGELILGVFQFIYGIIVAIYNAIANLIPL